MAEQRADDDADVIVASVPSLGRRSSRLERFDRRDFRCIIVDEAHHAVADTYLRIMDHFGIRSADNRILLWGCSATFSRYDERALDGLFEKVTFHVDLPDLVEQGFLAPAQVFSVFTDTDLSAVPMRSGDFAPESLSLAINTPVRNRLIVASWAEEALQKRQRRATIVFATNVDHVHGLLAAFSEFGVDCRAVTGATPAEERRQTLAEFAAGRVSVLVNCAVLTEGTDLPITDCIVMTRPTCNQNLYVQMVGRGLRRHADKQYCLVLDVHDRHRQKMRSLVSFPRLMARVVRGAVEEGAAEEGVAEGRPREQPQEQPQEIRLDGLRVQVEPVQALAVSLEEQPLAWVRISGTLWTMELRERRFLELQLRSHSRAAVSIVSPREERQPVVPEMPLHAVFGEVAAYLRRSFQGQEHRDIEFLTSRSVPWRRMPISPGQCRYLDMYARELPDITRDRAASIWTWSRGEAAVVLGRRSYVHRILGARLGSWSDLVLGFGAENK